MLAAWRDPPDKCIRQVGRGPPPYTVDRIGRNVWWAEGAEWRAKRHPAAELQPVRLPWRCMTGRAIASREDEFASRGIAAVKLRIA